MLKIITVLFSLCIAACATKPEISSTNHSYVLGTVIEAKEAKVNRVRDLSEKLNEQDQKRAEGCLNDQQSAFCNPLTPEERTNNNAAGGLTDLSLAVGHVWQKAYQAIGGNNAHIYIVKIKPDYITNQEYDGIFAYEDQYDDIPDIMTIEGKTKINTTQLEIVTPLETTYKIGDVVKLTRNVNKEFEIIGLEKY